LHAAGIGAAGDNVQLGARPLERLRVDVGLSGRLSAILLNAQMSGFGDGNLVLNQSTTGFGPSRSFRAHDRAMEAWYHPFIA
jgi:hypothetical protein